MPLVSVLIVTFNGYELTRRCIAAVCANAYPQYEVILVDNGSSDRTVERIREEFGEAVKIVALPSNLGPSAARNHGMRLATGEFAAFLDNDTVPDSQWLVNAVARMTADPTIGALQCRLMINGARNRFDYVGDYLGSSGFLVQPVRTGEEDIGQADQEAVILSAKSAGMLCRRGAFERAGGFDDDYFIFVEETDLALRMWLAGYMTIYLPTSVVYHEFSSSRNILDDRHTRLVRFHGCKNYICTLVKSLEGPTLAKMLPVHVALWLAFAAWNAVKGHPRSTLWILQGLWWNFTHLPATLAKRRSVQRSRVWRDAEILARVGRRDSLRSLFAKTKTTNIATYVSRARTGSLES